MTGVGVALRIMRARFASDFGGDLCPMGSGPLQHVMATTISGLSDARLYIGAITLALICRAGGSVGEIYVKWER